MRRGGTPGTVVCGRGGKWTGTGSGTGTEGTPLNMRVRGAAHRAGQRTHACGGLEELVEVDTDAARVGAFHSFLRSADGGSAPDGF